MFFNTVDKYSDKNLYYYKSDNKWIGINGNEVKNTVESLVRSLYSIGIIAKDNLGILSTNSGIGIGCF